MNYKEKDLRELLNQQLTVNPLNSTVKGLLVKQHKRKLERFRKDSQASKSFKKVLALNQKKSFDIPSPLLCPFCFASGSDLVGAFAVVCASCGEKFFFLSGGGGTLSAPIGEIYVRYEFSCLEMEEDFFQKLKEEKIIKIELFS